MFAAPPVGRTCDGPATKSPADSGVQAPANTAPAARTPFMSRVASRHMISKCSGAKRFTSSRPSSTVGVTQKRTPSRSKTRWMRALRESVSVCANISRLTASANAASAVTRSDFSQPEPCSAWLRRSAATHFAGTVPSARTAISLGPATWSMPT